MKKLYQMDGSLIYDSIRCSINPAHMMLVDPQIWDSSLLPGTVLVAWPDLIG